MDAETRQMLLKAKLFRLFSLVFAVTGLIIFMVLYFQHVDGAFFSAMTNPFVVTIVIVPFLPAAVLSWMAGRLERKYERAAEKE
jgi:hypothetical protein